MRIKTALTFVLISGFLLLGCTAKNVAYNPLTNINDKQAAALVTDLTMSQEASSFKPSNIEIQDSNILWENDRIFFKSVTFTELLQKSDKYWVQVNFKGDVFRKSDWLVVYSTADLEEAKRYIDALSSLIAARSNQPAGVDSVAYKVAAPNKSSVSPDQLIVPSPIAGNSGKFMCPFTASGTVALWAQKPVEGKDGGSNVAASVAGAAGQYAANKALEFVPFGLGGLIGRKAGESAARAATQKNIEPQLPTMDIVIASSDLSFNTADDLAVYMYAKNSTHVQYPQVLAMTKRVYPELQGSYALAIEKATQASNAKAEKTTHASNSMKEKSPQDRLKALKQLKADGLISEKDFSAKKSEILESL